MDVGRRGSLITSTGGLLPPTLLERVRALDKKLPGLSEDAYHLSKGDRFEEATTRAWVRLQTAWATFKEESGRLSDTDPATTPTRERLLLPIFETLGYGRLQGARAIELDGKSYAISHAWGSTPIHLVGANVSLDKRTAGVRGAAGQSPYGLLQELLNKSDDHLWGFVSNGRLLRVLRDNSSLTRLAYLEFDLEAIFEGESYAEFALLWLVCHQSRLEGPRPESTLIEQWQQASASEGTRALDHLRDGVERAISILGSGFLAFPRNHALLAEIRANRLSDRDYYRELLRVIYRLIFLFVAEERDALLLPNASTDARARYERYYSTANLRRLARDRRGTRHPDLWRGLQTVIATLGGNDGAPALGLPALGGFLFGSSACPNLDAADIANRDLLEAIRALALIREGNVTVAVDYRNLGSEELGSIYESLLAYHPEIHPGAAAFELKTAAGNERRTSGSYYTPTSLISALLDSALEPVLDEAIGRKTGAEAEAAILDISVVDPAVGSGHFLVAAAHRLAKRLAAVRTGEDEPSPADQRHALRDVVSKCLYGVDINPDAAELCRVGLWLEALEPGRPLSFLDAHVQTGNSLVGATPDLVGAGVPDAAFEPLDGDEGPAARGLRDRNAAERVGQLGLSDIAVDIDLSALVASWASLNSMGEGSVEQVSLKEHEYRRLVESPAARRQRLAADAWCGAFFTRKTRTTASITTASVRALAASETAETRATAGVAADALNDVGTFHWQLAFPDVFARGGFDLVLGNPPWETLSPDAKEFFAVYDAGVRNVSPREQKAIIERLVEDPVVKAAWDEYCWRLYRLANFLRKGGRYHLFAPGNLGKGDFNVYRIFVELALQLTRPGGRAAQVVPDGFYLGANASAIRRELVEEWQWDRVLGFENTREVWFRDIDSRTKFCIYIARKGGSTREIEVAFGITAEAELQRVRQEGGVALSADLLRELSPETYALPDTASLAGLDLLKRISVRFPRFGDRHPGWPDRVYMRELDMGNDRNRFNDREGYPLYEGRMVEQFDHRAKAYVSGRGRTAVWRDLAFGDPTKGIHPQWRVAERVVPAKVRERMREYRIGFCDVTSPTNERSLVAALLPPDVVSGDKVPTILLEGGTAADYMICLAVSNSLVLDYVARRKVSLKMSYTVVDGFPIPRRASSDSTTREIVALAARLTCTSAEMRPFWDELAASGWVDDWAPQGDAALTTEEFRLAARARLDALVAVHLFGLSASDMETILTDFKALANREQRRFGEFRTRRLVLAEVEKELAGRRVDMATGAEVPLISPSSAAVASAGPGHVIMTEPATKSSNVGPPRVQGVPAPAHSLFQAHADGAWLPEAAVDPSILTLGARASHRAFGPGTILSVENGPKSTQLLIRFERAGEKWIQFGFGLLEFESPG